MQRMNYRVKALEDRMQPAPGTLPIVVPDDTPPDEIERLRAADVPVVTFTAFVDDCT